LLGTVWLGFQAGMTFSQALMAGVIPYIPGDVAKMVIAMIFAPQIAKQVRAFGVNPKAVNVGE
jgi:biotin transport system substrate-specific component